VVQARAPFGVVAMVLEPFDEDEPIGIASEITKALGRLLRAEGMQIVQAADDATGQATLRGVVLHQSTVASPATGGDQAQVAVYRISLSIRAVLENDHGKTLWSASVTVADDFLPANVLDFDASRLPLATEANRRRALQRVAERAAGALHQKLVMAGTLAMGDS